jgi:hypothetical protein
MRKKMVDPIYRLTRAVEYLQYQAACRPDLTHVADELERAKSRLGQALSVSSTRSTRVA